MTDQPIRCATCDYWRRGGSKIAVVPDVPTMQKDIGTCEMAPPTVVVLAPGWVESVYPETRADRRCADWEPMDIDGGGGEKVDGENVVSIGRAA